MIAPACFSFVLQVVSAAESLLVVECKALETRHKTAILCSLVDSCDIRIFVHQTGAQEIGSSRSGSKFEQLCVVSRHEETKVDTSAERTLMNTEIRICTMICKQITLDVLDTFP